jgi:hypothetical protein
MGHAGSERPFVHPETVAPDVPTSLAISFCVTPLALIALRIRAAKFALTA